VKIKKLKKNSIRSELPKIDMLPKNAIWCFRGEGLMSAMKSSDTKRASCSILEVQLATNESF